MNKRELNSTVRQLRKLKHQADELERQIDELADKVKGYMDETGTDELSGSDWRVTWKTILSRRLDSKSLKASAPDIYEQFLVETASRRFLVS